jgi:D-alanine transaminase
MLRPLYLVLNKTLPLLYIDETTEFDKIGKVLSFTLKSFKLVVNPSERMDGMILYGERIIDQAEAHIDVEDRAYQFGDGVYEVIRVYGGKPFYLKEHLNRLERSAGEIRISLPYPLSRLEELLHELIRVNSFRDGNLYLQISRGTAPRNHAFPAEIQPLLIAYTQPSSRPFKELAEGIRAITTEDIRWLRCDIKSLNLLGAVLAKQQAVEQGAKEAILVRDGIITEGSSTNIFLVKNQTLLTHPANHLILHGITRRITLELAAELQIPVKQEPQLKEALLEADEVFMTSTTMEICPIVEIDGAPVGGGKPGAITRRLQEAFNRKVDQLHA